MADIRWAIGKMEKGERVSCDNGINVFFKDGENFRRLKRGNVTELRISNQEIKNKNFKVFKSEKAEVEVKYKKPTVKKKKKKAASKKKAA